MRGARAAGPECLRALEVDAPARMWPGGQPGYSVYGSIARAWVTCAKSCDAIHLMLVVEVQAVSVLVRVLSPTEP